MEEKHFNKMNENYLKEIEPILEKSADEMFEELGYYLDVENKVFCIWVNDDGEVIKFNKEYKKFYKALYCEQFEYITMEELKAINKKIEELQW